jgi:SH3-like domain-containing protein
MLNRHLPKRRLLPSLLAAGALLVAAGIAWSFIGHHHHSALADATTAGTTTGSTSQALQLGPSGLPVPRFVSLKTEKVNVRKGPSSDHAVAWVYQAKGLPVEITAEFETWRRVRDAEGAEGWILQNMLAGKRTALVAPSRKGTFINLMVGPSVESGPVAKLASGVLGDIKSCDGTWCRIIASGFDGYVDQNLIWGAYPGEVVN